MASEQKSSLGDILCGCLPWMRERAGPGPSPTRGQPPPQDGNTVTMNRVLSQMVSAPDVPLVETNSRSEADSPEWRALKIALQSLESVLDVFPPLKVAVGGLLECVMNLQIADQNRQEYEAIASELATLIGGLRARLPRSVSVSVPYSIENVARSLGELVSHVHQQKDRPGKSWIVAARDNDDDVLRCYRRMVTLFLQLQTDVSLSIWDVSVEGQTETRLQHLTSAHHAYYDTGLPTEMNQRGGCTANTRVGVLGQAKSWSKDERAARIYWMNGMAGTGKTTIAYSFCEQLENDSQLGASFFCSLSSPDCRDVNRIVPTIAYRLARYSSPFCSALCLVLGKEPDIARRKISVQFGKLIVEPLTKVKGAIPSDVVVVIDALDECTDTTGTKQVLELLFRHAGSLPIKFFVTSRPEASIVNKFTLHAESSHSILHLHEIERSLVEADIRNYLTEALKPIRPSADVIERLAVQAGHLFIFAATVVRYISPGDDTIDCRGRLSTMLGVTSAAIQRGYKDIDRLYLAILSKALEGDLDEGEVTMRRQVLWTAVCAREPLESSTLAEILDVFFFFFFFNHLYIVAVGHGPMIQLRFCKTKYEKREHTKDDSAQKGEGALSKRRKKTRAI